MPTPRKVSDVMSTDPVTVTRRTPFKELAEVLGRRRISAVPVVDGQGLVIGIVSQADLLPKEAYRDRVPTRREVLLHLEEIEKAGGTTAGDIMTVAVAVIGPHATLSEAARLMARRHVRRLPVVDGGGRLVGIVSRSDLLKVFLVTDEQLTAAVLTELTEALPEADTSGLVVTVKNGTVTIGGRLDDGSVIPALARIARAVEGVVDVEVVLEHPHPHRVGPPPDFQALY
ncbi:BON domain-containing protein [Streptomyces sp. 846.5]|nr:CBS domain-containing protein [Streptomyces sp. 846.5]TDT97374.1 BON domain-containing protein [Streptomyces sp. 846.5]